MRDIGLHLRLKSSLTELLHTAHELQLPIFQCFLISPSGFLLNPSEEEIIQIYPKMQSFAQRYLHASYWSNLASVRHTKHRVLMKELDLARRLGFTHLVMHPGSAKGALSQKEGIDAVARVLNTLLQHEPEVKLVLENVAHGNMSVGGNLQDFKRVLEKIDKPEHIFFCIDTAHAHSYGYDLSSADGRERFINEIQTTISIQKIALIHLNDTYDSLGSKRDRHAAPGNGKIGEDALRQLILDTRLRGIPLLLEPPELNQEELCALKQRIMQWHNE